MKLLAKVLQALCLMLAMLWSTAAGQKRKSTASAARLNAELRTGAGVGMGDGALQVQGIEGLRDCVKEHVLPNGMKFLLLARHTSPTIAIHVYFDVGSVDEQVGQTGIAHLYEHMAFKGTREIGTTSYQE